MKFAIIDDSDKKIVNIVEANGISDIETDYDVVELEPWMGAGLEFDIVGGSRVEKRKAETDKDKLSRYKEERDYSLNSIIIDVDGMLIQARPHDATNIQFGISTGETEWVLADDSVATVTSAQLQEAFDSGVVKTKEIWSAYKQKTKDFNRDILTGA